MEKEREAGPGQGTPSTQEVGEGVGTLGWGEEGAEGAAPGLASHSSPPLCGWPISPVPLLAPWSPVEHWPLPLCAGTALRWVV